jgi:hypothetical protein
MLLFASVYVLGGYATGSARAWNHNVHVSRMVAQLQTATPQHDHSDVHQAPREGALVSGQGRPQAAASDVSPKRAGVTLGPAFGGLSCDAKQAADGLPVQALPAFAGSSCGCCRCWQGLP